MNSKKAVGSYKVHKKTWLRSCTASNTHLTGKIKVNVTDATVGIILCIEPAMMIRFS